MQGERIVMTPERNANPISTNIPVHPGAGPCNTRYKENGGEVS
jgi:hypothetical protein